MREERRLEKKTGPARYRTGPVASNSSDDQDRRRSRSRTRPKHPTHRHSTRCKSDNGETPPAPIVLQGALKALGRLVTEEQQGPRKRGENQVQQRVEVNQTDEERNDKISTHVFFLPKEKNHNSPRPGDSPTV